MDRAKYLSDQATDPLKDFEKVTSSHVRNFFKPGKVFRTPWVEPADTAYNSDNDPNIVRGRYNGLLAEKIQWFIVFNSLAGHCHCVRVTTHSSRATTKPGVDPSHYCVLIPRGMVPKLLDDEQVPNPPIHVKLLKHSQEVVAAARIDLSRIYTVEYNVAVDAIGTIVPDDLKIMKILVNKIAVKSDAHSLLSSQYTATATTETDSGTFHIDNPMGNDDAISIRDALSALQANTAAVVRYTQSFAFQASMEWLSTTDFPAQQREIISRRQDGTAQWFLDSVKFKRWLQGPNEILWCYGIPGAGKTMIAAVAIEYLCRMTHNPDIGVAYLFCSYKAQIDQNVPNFVAALLKQLIQRQPDMAGQLMEIYDHHSKRGRKPSLDELTKALLSICSSFSVVYIIVDALDECSNQYGVRRELISTLQSFQATRQDVQLLFTSRYVPEVAEDFQSSPSLEVRASEEDVRRFVKAQIPRLPDCIQRDEGLKNDVQNTIAEVVDGMFLLAYLCVDSLLNKRNKQRVRSTLDKLSKGPAAFQDVDLEDVYGETIQRIEEQLGEDRLLARRAICWISHAERLLTARELCCALAIKPGDKALDISNSYEADDIISVCAGLVTVDMETSLFRFAHLSTREYLERIRLEWDPIAQEEIAMGCLTYLSFDAFKSGSSPSDESFEYKLSENVFLAYAAQYWVEHVRPVESSVSERALAFLCDQALVDCTVQAASVSDYGDHGYSERFPRRTTGLHLTAKHGLRFLTKTLLVREYEDSNNDIDVRDSYQKTPLFYAAEQGHEQIVQLLLNMRANVNAQCGEHGNALQAAFKGGHEAVVKLLQDSIADADGQGGEPGNTLLHAILKGSHEVVVKLQLDNEEAITVARQAGSTVGTDIMRTDYPNLGGKRRKLDFKPEDRYARTRAMADLEEDMQVMQKAVLLDKFNRQHSRGHLLTWKIEDIYLRGK
ncbi:MAG: hypothetical protein M1822_003946 [Bathelium mastoideum]|nr:MAG: hypothetical protein M1822_003946 [Bathelium mastoideum]